MKDPGKKEDPYDLNRFISAQEDDHERALSEIKDGRKRSHWMWYIFPQIDGLGSSAMSRRYRSRAQSFIGYLTSILMANATR